MVAAQVPVALRLARVDAVGQDGGGHRGGGRLGLVEPECALEGAEAASDGTHQEVLDRELDDRCVRVDGPGGRDRPHSGGGKRGSHQSLLLLLSHC